LAKSYLVVYILRRSFIAPYTVIVFAFIFRPFLGLR
jgi:hypothetical protein